jgi:hypothetical protein
MALIKCPECGTEVSDKAEKCPKCSYPIATSEKHEQVQVIEKTSKALKQQVIYASLTAIIGFCVLIAGSAVIGLAIFVAGVISMIATRAQIWWHHE